DGRWRLPVKLKDVDPNYIKMLIAYEDRRFHEHKGVDERALLRAAWQAFASAKIVSGGSTLTMQTVRLIEETGTRSLKGKAQQIRRARAYEAHLSKQEILELYLARAPFGGNIEGVRAASLIYFGKEPKRLTRAEAALLVALPQAPEARRPDRSSEKARVARDRVLDRLLSAEILSAEEVLAAKTEPVPKQRRAIPKLAPHLAQHAVSVNSNGVATKVGLTVERDLQQRLETFARERARRLGKKVSIAILVADHRSGEILASVGSSDLFSESRFGHVDMTRARRSPGSTLKPFIYGLAFDEGLAHPDSLIADRPISFGGYSPKNFDKEYMGTVTIREALALSLNIPAIQMLEQIGPARLVSALKRAGVHPKLPRSKAPGLAIGLGGLGVNLRDLVTAYASLARGGSPLILTDQTRAPTEKSGNAELSMAYRSENPKPVISQKSAAILTEMLAEKRATPRHGNIAFKTGTSYGYRDAWVIGYDGAHVVGIWVGRADGAPVPGQTGNKTAVPILKGVFSRIGPNRTPIDSAWRLSGVVRTSVPQGLAHVGRTDRRDLSQRDGPSISFPLEGAQLDTPHLAKGNSRSVAVKFRSGDAPFHILINGKPIGSPQFNRQLDVPIDGTGFSTITVLDAKGRSDRVSFRIQ
ncbi:MAG: penicillin-binding protein 1C, partial [Stappiaceae bacterium]